MKDDRIKMFFIWAGILLTWVIFVALFMYGVAMMFGTIGVVVVFILAFIYYVYNLYKIW
jgi:hypothetical protein